MNPHKVLDRFFDDYDLVVSYPDYFFSLKGVRFILYSTFFVFFVSMKINFLKANSRIVFREFNITHILVIFMLVRNRDSVFFNINHNLKDRKNIFCVKVLSFFFKIIFIDPHPDILSKYPFIIPLYSFGYIQRRRLELEELKNFLIIVGNRPEQINFTVEDIGCLVQYLKNSGFNTTVIGKNFPDGVFLSDKEFVASVRESYVVNYVSYNNRHSGTVWFLLENSPFFFQFHSNVASIQTKNYERVLLFKNNVDLIREIGFAS